VIPAAGALGQPLPARISTLSVAKLAWPAVVSYLLGNAYRINDQ